MALNMAGSQGDHIKQLSKYTVTTIHHTCNEIVSLWWHLLPTSHKCVLLGQFTHDLLKKNLVNFVWFVGFYGISTFVGYLTPNPFYVNNLFYLKQFSLA